MASIWMNRNMLELISLSQKQLSPKHGPKGLGSPDPTRAQHGHGVMRVNSKVAGKAGRPFPIPIRILIVPVKGEPMA